MWIIAPARTHRESVCMCLTCPVLYIFLLLFFEHTVARVLAAPVGFDLLCSSLLPLALALEQYSHRLSTNRMPRRSKRKEPAGEGDRCTKR